VASSHAPAHSPSEALKLVLLKYRVTHEAGVEEPSACDEGSLVAILEPQSRAEANQPTDVEEQERIFLGRLRARKSLAIDLSQNRLFRFGQGLTGAAGSTNSSRTTACSTHLHTAMLDACFVGRTHYRALS
jgi:hypothetical protein